MNTEHVGSSVIAPAVVLLPGLMQEAGLGHGDNGSPTLSDVRFQNSIVLSCVKWDTGNERWR